VIPQPDRRLPIRQKSHGSEEVDLHPVPDTLLTQLVFEEPRRLVWVRFAAIRRCGYSGDEPSVGKSLEALPHPQRRIALPGVLNDPMP
jgi:hypothetical protein